MSLREKKVRSAMKKINIRSKLNQGKYTPEEPGFSSYIKEEESVSELRNVRDRIARAEPDTLK